MKLRSILKACSLFAVLALLVMPMTACDPNEEEYETEMGDTEIETEVDDGQIEEIEVEDNTAETAVEDAAITAAINAKFAADPDVGMFEIDVDTTNGVVTLSGDVEQAGAVEQAVAIAQDQDGVIEVINNLTTDLSEELD